MPSPVSVESSTDSALQPFFKLTCDPFENVVYNSRRAKWLYFVFDDTEKGGTHKYFTRNEVGLKEKSLRLRHCPQCVMVDLHLSTVACSASWPISLYQQLPAVRHGRSPSINSCLQCIMTHLPLSTVACSASWPISFYQQLPLNKYSYIIK